MFDKKSFGPVVVPIFTTFDQNGDLDLERLAILTDYLIQEERADTLVVSGTTGEFFTQTSEERIQTYKTVFEANRGRLPLVAGIGAQSTKETLYLGQSARDLGYDTQMIVSPYYTKPNQEEILEHYRTVAEALPDVSFLLYNIPIFTGVNVEPQTLSELAALPNIVGIKEEAELNAKQITRFVNATPDEFIIINGDDTMILEAYLQGGRSRIGGVVSGASHVFGKYIRAMINSFLEGDVEEATSMQRALYPVLRVMGINNRTNPVALWKEALKLSGFECGGPRSPLLPATADEREAVRLALNTFAATSVAQAHGIVVQ